MSRRLTVSLALTMLALAPIGEAGVVVVDPLGLPGGPILQTAISAALPGDILLVRAGNYVQATAIDIDAKSITLINDSGASLTLPRLLVRNTPGPLPVVVRGFVIGTATSQSGTGLAGVDVVDNAGTVWLEECQIIGGVGWDSFPTIHPSAAIAARNTPSLVVERCVITGGKGFFSEFTSQAIDGASGITLENSGLSMHDTVVDSGSAGFGSSQPAGYEGAGLSLAAASTAVVAGSTITGAGTKVLNATSEPGVEVFDALSRLYLRFCTVAAGTSQNGVVGPSEIAPAGTIVVLTEPPMSFEASSPHRAGELVHLELTGTPGDLAAMFVGVIGPATFLPDTTQGTFILSAPVIGPLALAPLPATGVLSIDLPAAPLPASVTGATVGLLGAVLSPPGTLEAASAYVQVDPAF